MSQIDSEVLKKSVEEWLKNKEDANTTDIGYAALLYTLIDTLAGEKWTKIKEDSKKTYPEMDTPVWVTLVDGKVVGPVSLKFTDQVKSLKTEKGSKILGPIVWVGKNRLFHFANVVAWKPYHDNKPLPYKVE